MYLKGDIPTIYYSEATQYLSMVFITKTTTGAYSFFSASSGTTYSGGSGGQQALFDALAVVLNDYQMTGVDWNVVRSWIYGAGSPVIDGGKVQMNYDSTGVLSSVDLIDEMSLKMLSTSFVFTNSILASATTSVYDSDGTTVILQFTDTLVYIDNWLNFGAGDCEDHTLWTAASSTLTTDTSNKIQGNASVKVTITATAGSGYYNAISILDPSKYYFISGYIKHGTGTNSRFRIFSDGTGRVVKESTFITNTTNFVNTGMTLLPSDWGTGSTYMRVFNYVTGVASDYGYFDSIKIWEISAADALLSESQLLVKYPNVPNANKGNLYSSIRAVII